MRMRKQCVLLEVEKSEGESDVDGLRKGTLVTDRHPASRRSTGNQRCVDHDEELGRTSG